MLEKKIVEKFKEPNLEGIKSNNYVPWTMTAINWQNRAILRELRRRQLFVWDRNKTVFSLFARMCKENVELFRNPDLLVEHSFSRRVRVCIFPKIMHPFVQTFVDSFFNYWTLFNRCSYRSNKKFNRADKSFQWNGSLP